MVSPKRLRTSASYVMMELAFACSACEMFQEQALHIRELAMRSLISRFSKMSGERVALARMTNTIAAYPWQGS